MFTFPPSIPSLSLMKYSTTPLMHTPSHQFPTHTNENNCPRQQPNRSTKTHMVRRPKLGLIYLRTHDTHQLGTSLHLSVYTIRVWGGKHTLVIPIAIAADVVPLAARIRSIIVRNVFFRKGWGCALLQLLTRPDHGIDTACRCVGDHDEDIFDDGLVDCY